MSEHRIYTIHRVVKEDSVNYYVAPKGTTHIEYHIRPFPYPTGKSKWEKRLGCLLIPLKVYFFIADFFENVIEAAESKVKKEFEKISHRRLIVMDSENQNELVVTNEGKGLAYALPSDLDTNIATLYFHKHDEKSRRYDKGKHKGKKHDLVIYDNLYATFINENGAPYFKQYYFLKGEQKIAFFNLSENDKSIGECAIHSDVTRGETMYLLGSILFHLYPRDNDE